jgi:hypothetical protein
VDRRHLITTSGIALTSYNTPIRRWLTTPVDPDAAHTSDATARNVGHTDITELLAAADEARRWDSRRHITKSD